MYSYHDATYVPEGAALAGSYNREYTSSLAGLERAMQSGKILEAPVLLCDNKLCLHVDLMGVDGVIEKDDVVYSPTGEPIKDIAVITRVGKPVCFKVIGITQKNGRTVARLSRREAQRECLDRFVSQLRCGDIIPAKVTHMESFGAFVDIGCGIISLLSIDCISVSRISHPRDRLSIGLPIQVAVKVIDKENHRIFVSMRELLGTWEQNASEFEVGQTVAGIVRSVEPYGIFIELAPNLAGLAELRNDIAAPLPEQLIGRYTAVYIKSIIPERMKVKLVMVDSYHGDIRKMPLRYYISAESCPHMDYWRYSPECSSKLVETIFQ